ncbi:hypothetical protein FML14_10030 [Klebsiella oxytoca]|nr:hypothetical protein [Klebsiella oxytoca]MBZ7589001.1 hypothetical protein [Klebsiella oxytoca]MBZ7632339.1 hypothetical protein [Klebsiella oxytoca]RBA00475.1 hypothetical protein DK853_05725 [Klebsiella oxytoca]HAU6243006.1 hypothetical protein [Klebsiella oxytoca]
MHYTNSFIIIIIISFELFILDFTYIVTIDIYQISICSFSMSLLPWRKQKQKQLKDCLNEKKSTGPRYPGIISCWRCTLR